MDLRILEKNRFERYPALEIEQFPITPPGYCCVPARLR